MSAAWENSEVDTDGSPTTKRSRVLVNATTCSKGGSLQMATMFLRQSLQNPTDFDWRFAVSTAVGQELAKFGLNTADMHVFESSPARDTKSRDRLLELESACVPDLVFTVAGPAYVRFKAKHVVVCAEPWVTHATMSAYRSLRFPDEWLRIRLLTAFKRSSFRTADAWILQTETARRGLQHNIGAPAAACFVIPATCDAQYHDANFTVPFPALDQKLRLLCFTAPYKHKNLLAIPHVAERLSILRPTRTFEFVFTLPIESSTWRALDRLSRRLGVRDRIVNLGPIPVAEGAALYRSCHVCFLPTVLESFSATYPEAMAMGMPIVTSDLNFAHDVCRDAALYFPPRDPQQAAARIAELIDNRTTWDRLVANGKTRIAELPTPAEQYRMDVEVFRQVLGQSPVKAE